MAQGRIAGEASLWSSGLNEAAARRDRPPPKLLRMTAPIAMLGRILHDYMRRDQHDIERSRTLFQTGLQSLKHLKFDGSAAQDPRPGVLLHKGGAGAVAVRSFSATTTAKARKRRSARCPAPTSSTCPSATTVRLPAPRLRSARKCRKWPMIAKP